MGTRCLTVFQEEDGTEIAVLSRQYDGHPDGHGVELRHYLTRHRIVNGIRGDSNKDNAFNGMSCLAASVVAHFKDDIGGFYLRPAGTRDVGEDYIYTITNKDGQPHIETVDCYGLLKPKVIQAVGPSAEEESN